MPSHEATALRHEATYFQLPHMIEEAHIDIFEHLTQTFKVEAYGNTSCTQTVSSKPKKRRKEPSTKVFNLTPELATLVGARNGEMLTRSEVCKRIWAYIKANDLQDPEDRQYFTPDAKMQPIFGTERSKAFNMLYPHVNKHLLRRGDK